MEHAALDIVIEALHQFWHLIIIVFLSPLVNGWHTIWTRL
jgi:hypothetical protein